MQQTAGRAGARERTKDVLVVDDHPLFRDGLASLVRAIDGFDVVGQACDGREAVRAAASLKPDLVLMDLRMPGMSGVEATQQIVEQAPTTAVLIVSMFRDDEALAAARRAGARGYVLKGAQPDEIVRAITAVADGREAFAVDPPAVAQTAEAVVAATVCVSCGHDNPPSARFCAGCAAALPPAPARTRVIGRDRELAELAAGLEGAGAAHGGLFMLVGPAGVGKTTLVREFARRAREVAARVAWGSCWEGAGAPAFWPWIQVLRAYVADSVGPASAGGEAGAQELLARLEDAPPPAAGTDGGERFALFDAVARFLARASRDRPAVIVLEDLHAADQPSLLMLEFAARELLSDPVMLIGTFRDRDPRTSRGTAELLSRLAAFGQRLPVAGFTIEESRTFIGEFIDDPAERLVDAAHRVTEGNPFFINELVRVIAAEGGADAWQGGEEDIPLPDAVRAAIRRRLELLSDETREVLAYAAVLGRQFTLASLQRVAGERAGAVRPALEEALETGVVVVSPRPAGRLAFAHALIRETLVSELPPLRRLELHNAVGEALESHYAADPGPHVAELAFHFITAAPVAGVGKATSYATRAGDRAMRSLAFEEAAVHYERALDVLELEPATDPAQRTDLLLASGAALRRSGDAAAARRTFLEAADAARASGDPRRLASAALGYGAGLGGYGFVEEADPQLITLLEEALATLPEADDVLRVRVLSRLASELYFTAQTERRERLTQEALDVAQRLGEPRALLTALYSRHWATLGPDDPEGRLGVGRRIARIAAEIDDPEMQFRGHHVMLAAQLEIGEMNGVAQAVEACARLAERLKQPTYRWQVCALRAMMRLLDGDFRGGGELARQALEAGRRASLPMAQVDFGAQALEEHWGLGDLASIEPAVRHFADHYTWAPAWRAALAFVHAELEDRDAAREHVEPLAARGFDDVPRDGNWLMTLALAAVAVAQVEDRDAAQRLYALLTPYAGRHATVAAGAASAGAIDGFLGLLAAVVDGPPAAVPHLEAAVRINLATGNRPWAARMGLELARCLAAEGPHAADSAATAAADGRCLAESLEMSWLVERFDRLGSPARPRTAEPAPTASPAVRATMTCDGEYWTIDGPATTLRLRDAVGLGYLATLLQHPDVEFHALDLATGSGASPSAAAAGAAAGADAPALDPHAKAAYRDRIVQLRAEADEAERFNDPERAERAREELAFVGRELAAAVGLGGRDRPTGSASERARLNVTRALRSVIRKVADADPETGEYLMANVRTGTFCSYSPPARAPIAWDVRR